MKAQDNKSFCIDGSCSYYRHNETLNRGDESVKETQASKNSFSCKPLSF